VTPELLVVCYPEDLVLEFLSMLDSPVPLRVVVAATGAVLDLPAKGLPRRLALVAEALTAEVTAPTSGSVAALVREELRAGSVWTHSPADERLDRAKVAVWTARAAGRARCSVGVSAHLRFVADTTVALQAVQVARKLDWLGSHRAEQVERAGGPRGIGIAAVADVERYVTVLARQAARLFALRHDWHLDVDSGGEPWDFAVSPYERQRLRSTADWISRHLPRPASVVELGSCEGALTELLLDDGFAVNAQEPVTEFQRRFTARAGGRPGLTTGTRTIEELAGEQEPPADAYLLIEMLNYVADLAVIDKLATDQLFISNSPQAVRTRIMPWLERSPVWQAVAATRLAAPRFELVVDGLAYHRKLGSNGVLVRRR
jgi:hypothetical protein